MVDRESARSLAQKKRRLEMPGAPPRNTFMGPTFSEPVKTKEVDNDLQNILGNFSRIKNEVMDSSSMPHLLGIPKEPQTPVDNKTRPLFDSTEITFTPNGQVKTSKPAGQSNISVSSQKEQSSGSSSSSKKGSPFLKNGQKNKETSKQAPKTKPGGSSVSPQVAPTKTSSPSVISKTKKSKDKDVKVNLKKEKDVEKAKGTDGSSSSSSKGKQCYSASSDTKSKSPTKKSTTPVKAKSSSANTKSVSKVRTKKEFKTPNGMIKSHLQTSSASISQDIAVSRETSSAAAEPQSNAPQENKSTDLSKVGDDQEETDAAKVTRKLFDQKGTSKLFDVPPDSTSEGKPDIKKDKLSVPKLQIPSLWGPPYDPSNQDVEKILNRMTEIKSPLTAIQNTPIKLKNCEFPFSTSTLDVKTTESKNSLLVPGIVPPCLDRPKQEPDPSPPGSPTIEKGPNDKKPTVKSELANDLLLSEDESDCEEPHTVKEELAEETSQRHSDKMDAGRLSDSSSGSSSGESDDDSSSGNESDSESDASSVENELSLREKSSYNLHNLIHHRGIIEGQKSPGALNPSKQPPLAACNPPAATTSTATTPTPAVREPQPFPNTNQHRPNVQGGRRGEGKFVIGVKDLTTVNPHEDYDGGSFSKYNDNNMTDFNKLSNMSNERRTPLPKSPVRTSGSGSKPVVKRCPKKPLEKAPSVGKSKVNSQGRNDTTSKESKTDVKGSKQSKQSSISSAEHKTGVKTKCNKTNAKVEKKTPPRSRTPEKKSAKKPLTSEFVSDTDSSDSDSEVIERTLSPKKVNGASKTHSVFTPPHKSTTSTEIRCKTSSKGNRTKEKGKSNSVKLEKETTMAPLEKVFMSMIGPHGSGPLSEPLLSPIKSEETDKIFLTPHMNTSEVTYKDGTPSLVVKLNRSLLNRVPEPPLRDPCRTERTPEHIDSVLQSTFKNEEIDMEEERPPPLVKVKAKRKQEDLEEEENLVKESMSKKPKSDMKSSKNIVTEESEHIEYLLRLPDSDTVLDRRRPPERRSSTNSVSSLLSSQSSSSRRSDRESQPSKRRKKTTNDSLDSSCSSSSSSSSGGATTTFQNVPSNPAMSSIKGHEWGSPPPQGEERTDRSQDSRSVSNDVTCTRNGHTSAGEEWGDGAGGDYTRTMPHAVRKNQMDKPRIDFEERQQFSADSYLTEGKKLKRQADFQTDKNVKSLMYFDAVLSFILCGNAMENDPVVPDEKASTMYSETCDIIKFILKFKGSHLNQDALSMDKKLAVLCHRCQGLLYMKMFKMKKSTGMKLARVLGEHFKHSSKSQQAAQTPSPWSASRYTGTPSPMSPTPSPAGSVGSVGSLGSQGSNNCDASGNTLLPSSLPQVQGNKLTNGVPHIMSSPANVSVPQSIVNKMSTFIQTSNYGYYGLDFWEQADTLAQENIEFFQELDRELDNFGHLTLHSSTLDLVRYARLGLRKLKNS
ncbi:AF4/FMR2 family member 4-like isoform X1 [Asterias rubens]|uniref:AF4/FMR2 family member 4-like isoform X1 n=1 Tax=Asterias rubens TaxID=7604 RepID=UPI001454EC39|nr:AF4/FMR2 family member 4-like isoform X1 [Asterias rubens]